MRRSATRRCSNRITYYTTLAGARAACVGMRHLEEMRAYDIQSLHASLP